MKNRGSIPYYNRKGVFGQSSFPLFNDRIKGNITKGGRLAHRPVIRKSNSEAPPEAVVEDRQDRDREIVPRKSPNAEAAAEVSPEPKETNASSSKVVQERTKSTAVPRKRQGRAEQKQPEDTTESRTVIVPDPKSEAPRNGRRIYGKRKAGRKLEVERMDSLFNELALLDEEPEDRHNRSRSHSGRQRSEST